MNLDDRPDYVDALHLRALPFESDTGIEMFFADPHLTQRLEQLQHLARFGGMVLVVEGQTGSGKTTLLRQLATRSGSSWNVCLLQGSEGREPLAYIRRIARQFDLDDSTDPDNLKRSIFDYCQVMAQTSQVQVVVMDDADRVSMAVLGQILTLGGSPAETAQYLRIVLFGTPGLEDSMVQAGICDADSSLLHSVIMHPFDEEQTDAYLVYRLSMAGFSGTSPFSPMEVKAIHKSAAGLPLRINRLAHQTLMEHVWAVPRQGHARKSGGAPFFHKISPANLSREGKWLGAGVVAVLAAGILWLTGPSPEPGNDGDAGMLNEQLALPLPTVSTEVELAATSPVPERVEADPEAVPAETVVISRGAGESEEQELLLPVPPRPREIAATAGSDKAGSTDPDGGIAAAMVVPDVGNDDSAAVMAETAETVPESAPGTIPVPATQPDVTPPDSNVPEPEVATTVAAVTPEQGGKTWLLSQKPDTVTLQLLGVSQESSVRRFLGQHQFREPTAYFHTLRKGKDWYVLVHGVYPDNAAAKAAIASLPDDVRKAGPWPRTFATIQTDIQASGSP